MSADDAHAPNAATNSGAAARKGMIWNTLSFVTAQVFGLTVFLVMANRLEPAVFGVFALALVFVDYVAMVLKSAAVDSAVQRQDFSARATSTYFFALAAVTALAMAGFTLAAPWAAAAFKAPDLTVVLQAAAWTLPAMPFLAMMEAKLMSALRFRDLAIRTILTTVFGGAVGLAVAFSPAPEWSLVAQRAGQVGAALILLFIATRWAPRLAFDVGTARAYGASVAQLFGAQALAGTMSRVFDTTIGLRYGPETLGLARVFVRFIEVINSALTNSITNLWVPLLSRAKDDPDRRRLLFLRLSGIAAAILAPAFIGLALVGPDLAAALLPPAYAPVGVYLHAAAVFAVVITLGFFRSAILIGLGRYRTAMVFAVVDLLAYIAACVAAALAGDIVFFLFASQASSVITALVWSGLACRLFNVRPGALFAAIAPAFAASIVMAGCALGVGVLLEGQPAWLRLAALIGTGACGYLGAIALFHRRWITVLVSFLMQKDADAPPAPVAASGAL